MSMKVNIQGFGSGMVDDPLTGIQRNLFGNISPKRVETKEEKIMRTKLKYGLFHGNGIRKKKPRKKRKKTYGKQK